MKMNSQGLGSGPTGTSMTLGQSRRAKARRNGTRNSSGVLARARFGAEASGKGDEIGIGQVAADQPIAVAFLLNAPHIAESAVVEHDGDQRNAVAHRRGKLCRGEKEAAIARNRHDRHVGPCMLRAERGGETPAERVLITGR